MEQTYKRNLFFSFTFFALCGFSSAIMSLSLTQEFLIANAFPAQRLAQLGTITFVSQLVAYFLFASIGDKLKRPLALAVVSYTLPVLSCIVMIVLSIYNPFGPAFAVYTVLGLTFVITLVTSAYTVVDSKVFYSAVGSENFKRANSINVLLLSAAGVFGNLIFIQVAKRVEYPNSMILLFSIGSVILIIAAFFLGRLKLVHYSASKEKTVSPFKSMSKLFKLKIFTKMIPANIFRGFGSAYTYLIYPVAILRLNFGLAESGFLAMASTIGMIAGNFLVTVLIKRIGSNKLTLAGAIVSSLGFAALMISPWGWLYIGAAFVVACGATMLNSTFPIGIIEFIPFDKMGSYTSGRYLLNAIISTVTLFSMQYLPDVAYLYVFAVIAVFQLLTGFCYYVTLRKFETGKYENEKLAAEQETAVTQAAS